MTDAALTWNQIVAAKAATLGRAPVLDELIELCRTYRMSDEEIAAQRLSYVTAELAFGSDAEEAALVAAMRSGNAARVAALKKLSQDRVDAFKRSRE